MKKYFIIGTILFASLFGFVIGKYAIGTSSDKLVPFTKGDMWGYKDSNGKVVVKPKFQFAEKFYEGRALIIQGNKYGYINKRGDVVIKAKYYNAKRFSDGLAQVAVNEENVYGYINNKGTMVIKPMFKSIVMDDFTGASKEDVKKYLNFGLFKDGRAHVCVGKKFFIIDKKGNILGQAKSVYH